MIDQSVSSSLLISGAAKPRPAAVLRMVPSERMGGSIPVWERPDKNAPVVRTAEEAAALAPGAGEVAENSFSAALSYAAQESVSPGDESAPQEFGFGDLLDMINPLQHIPVVSHLYRSVTGDDIRPIARIVGGTVFGGPVGGAVSLANVIVEEETGRDITGNVIALAAGEKDAPSRHTPDVPEKRLDEALRLAQQEPAAGDAAALPGTALAFADLRAQTPPVKEKTVYQYQEYDERTAGMARLPRAVSLDESATTMPREPVTQLAFSALPPMRFND